MNNNDSEPTAVVDADEKDSEDLIILLRTNPHHLLELLQQNKVPDINSNKSGVTVLHVACADGKDPMVFSLLNAGADPNAVDEERSTPLFYAANSKIVELLVQFKARVNLRNAQGATALHAAVAFGRLDVCSALLKSGIDVSVRAADGRSALDVALETAQISVAAVIQTATLSQQT